MNSGFSGTGWLKKEVQGLGVGQGGGKNSTAEWSLDLAKRESSDLSESRGSAGVRLGWKGEEEAKGRSWEEGGRAGGRESKCRQLKRRWHLEKDTRSKGCIMGTFPAGMSG